MDAVVMGVVGITASAWPTLHDFTYSQPEYVSGLSSHLHSVDIVSCAIGSRFSCKWRNSYDFTRTKQQFKCTAAFVTDQKHIVLLTY